MRSEIDVSKTTLITLLDKINVIEKRFNGESDIDLALKMLSDYYKRREVSGKVYRIFAGNQLTATEE